MEDIFRSRIGYYGDLSVLSKRICSDYGLGDYVSETLLLLGYEDFNLILETSKDRFFVKVFANFRSLKDCRTYLGKITSAINAGIATPKLLKSKQGYLHKLTLEGKELYLCVMDFISGHNLYELNITLTVEQIKFLARQASIINSLDLKPKFVYDSWAIVNFKDEYERKAKYLSEDDLILVRPLLEEFDKLGINELPHCFVHGDIISTNVMEDENSNLFIIDFSVGNQYPRIQELAILACNLFFDSDSKKNSENNLKIALEEYQKKIKLSPKELGVLPSYIKIAHAMHLLCANYENVVEKNNSKENEYWLLSGRTGLEQD